MEDVCLIPKGLIAGPEALDRFLKRWRAWLLVYTVWILLVAVGPVYFVPGGLEVEEQEGQKERAVEP